MSVYTTEVRWIIQQMTGIPPERLDESIEAAWPMIFDFPFPLFDDEYRSVLCQKILKYFYTREIGMETVGLWKLRLNQKLNMIMPYYNKLYLSEQLEYDPLLDVDLTTIHSGKGGEESTVDSSETDTGSTTKQEYTSSSGENTGTTNSTETGSITDEGTGTTTKTTQDTDRDERTENRALSHTEMVKDDGSGKDTRSIDRNGTTNEEETSESNGTEGVTNRENTLDSQQNNTATKQSDTPQGSLLDWQSDNYMSFGQVQTGSNSGTKETTGNQDTTTTGSTTSTSKSTSEDTTTDVLDRTTSNTRNTTGSGTDNLTINGTQTRNGSMSSTENTSHNGSHNTSVDGTSRETSKAEESVSGGTTSQGSKTGQKRGTAKTTEEYITKVTGRRGGKSYSQLIMEYRDSLINIDMMVIDELEELFMQIW